MSPPLKHFRVRYEMGPERIDIAVTETSAIRAMESVLRQRHAFIDSDNVRDFCARIGCTVSATPTDEPTTSDVKFPDPTCASACTGPGCRRCAAEMCSGSVNHRTPGLTACSDPKCSVVIQHDAHPPGRWPGFEDAMRTAFDRPFVVEYKGKRPNSDDAARVSPEDRAAVEAVPRQFGLRAPGCYRLYFNRHGAAPLVWCVAPDGGGWELAVKSVEITAPCATVYTAKPTPDDEDGQPSAWIRVEGVLTVDADGHATVGPA